MRIWTGWLIALGLVLAACGGDDGEQESATPTPSAAVRAALQTDYDALLEAQQAVGDIWETLGTGGQVTCGEMPAVISPESISAQGDPTLEPLAEVLRQAAVRVQNALDLWQAECLNPRAQPAPDVIDRGRLAARSAGDALHEAQQLLAGLEP